MKKPVNLIFIVLLSLFIASCYNDDYSQIEEISTTIEGRVLDIERDIAYSDDTIVLIKHYTCGSWFTSGPCYEIIDSTNTDTEGNYEFTFNYETDGGYYVYRKATFKVFPEDLELPRIIAGEKNIVDFQIWKPIILELDLSIQNNDFPGLQIKSRILDDFYIEHDFPYATIQDRHIDTLIYLYAKPNSNMRISFNYTDNHPTANYRELKEFLQTSKQDTIVLSYIIDCQSFETFY